MPEQPKPVTRQQYDEGFHVRALIEELQLGGELFLRITSRHKFPYAFDYPAVLRELTPDPSGFYVAICEFRFPTEEPENLARLSPAAEILDTRHGQQVVCGYVVGQYDTLEGEALYIAEPLPDMSPIPPHAQGYPV